MAATTTTTNYGSLTPHGLLVMTAAFAARKHGGQTRKDFSRTPYILHPLTVASYLVEAGVEDVATLQAALLHDTVEDTGTQISEIVQVFGADVASIVAEVTDDKSLAKAERKRRQIEKARVASHQAKLVKLADKLHNLGDLIVNPPPGWTVDRIQGYFVWCRFVVDAIRGTNEHLEKRLDAIFATWFIGNDGKSHRCIPGDDGDLPRLLEKYYASC